MEYHLAIKMSKVLTHATAWVNLEHIMLGERSQSVPKEHILYDYI